MWEQCNKILHATSKSSQFIQDSKINEEIRQIYLSGFQALPRDAFAFLRLPLEVQLSKPHHVKEQWVASVRVAIKRKAKHEHGNYLAEQCLMRQWLGLDS